MLLSYSVKRLEKYLQNLDPRRHLYFKLEKLGDSLESKDKKNSLRDVEAKLQQESF